MAVSACGGGGSNVSINDLETQLVSAECHFAVACNLMPDIATCTGTEGFDDNYFETIKTAVANGTIKYDSGEAGKCVSAYQSLSCSYESETSSGLETDDNNPCDKVFTGTVAVGSACFVTEQCVPNAQCDYTMTNCDTSTSCCTGMCTAIAPKVALGGDCSSGECVDGAYCKTDDTTQTQTCTKQLTSAGATCDAQDSCAAPLACDQTTLACVKPAAHGATCNPQNFPACDDARDNCDSTMTCNSLVGIGGACDPTMFGQCVEYADCDSTSQKCVERSKVGGSCSTTGGTPNCLGSLTCNSGTCAAPPAAMSCI
ncbi:MAG TPA: hypothetical protein VLX92_01640 [Kofleriaceae bacterium]|nr:hypothetical protein [Kofleriaceae bacterium]